MGTLLISLVSDQTIPNVQLIKEYKNQVTDFLFISTQFMENKGCRRWVEKAAFIDSLAPIIVDEYSYDDIQNKLNDFDFSIYDRLVLNLTGGTKVMTLAAHDFFKEEGADIFYITGKDNKYIKIFPGKKKHVEILKEKLSIKDYLTAYGFELVLSKNKNLDKEVAERVYNFFVSERVNDFVDVLNYLRNFRSRGVKSNSWTIRIEEFLNEIGFRTSVDRQLSDYEAKFLTGEWFEQYVYYKIIDGLGLDEDMIYNGVTIIKEVKDNESIKVESLLGVQDLKRTGSDNEIDVMFMYNGKFYVIECKSSIIDKKEVEINKNGKMEKVLKDNNILGETIYKSDSIKTKFGLFANSYIFTLTDFKAYINEGDTTGKNNRFKSMSDLINRAALSKIEIRDRSKLIECKNYKELL